MSLLAKRAVLHGIHVNPASATSRFNLAMMVRAQVRESTSTVRRQLIASLQLNQTHMLTRLAIAAEECDYGNNLGSEIHLIEALYGLRSLDLQSRYFHGFGCCALSSHVSALRILILTNFAVLHQRRGESKSAQARYQQIKELSPHLPEGHNHLIVHATWCEATHTLAAMLENESSMNTETRSVIGGTDPSDALKRALEVPMPRVTRVSIPLWSSLFRDLLRDVCTGAKRRGSV